MAITTYNSSTLYGVPATCQELCFVGRALSGHFERPSEAAVITPVLGLRVRARGCEVTCPGSHSEPGAGPGWELPQGSQDTPSHSWDSCKSIHPSPQTCKCTL